MTKKNKNHTQQPDVKVNSSSLGEGECTEEGITSVIENPLKKSASSGSLESGKAKQYPSAETGRNESEEERINKKLITDYILFNADCVENYIRGWKEIQGLYKIKLELKHLI